MGFDHDHVCSTGLVLGLGFSTSQESRRPTTPTAAAAAAANKKATTTSSATTNTAFEPCLLTLGLSNGTGDEAYDHNNRKVIIDVNKSFQDHNQEPELQNNTNYVNVHDNSLYGRQASPHSAVSSFSSGRVKRERDLGSDQEIEVEKGVSLSRVSDEDEDGTNARKKLRLTKEQSALLEESFKQHSTLNPKQKQALARQLNLRPRQVEVWFQNRRARTKLKQTEVDCEFLKKCCETLTDENRRLQKELQELKALKLAQPLYMHMPAATLTMCPSCERFGGGVGGDVGGGSAKSPFSMAPKQHFYNPFTNPSAAC